MTKKTTKKNKTEKTETPKAEQVETTEAVEQEKALRAQSVVKVTVTQEVEVPGVVGKIKKDFDLFEVHVDGYAIETLGNRTDAMARAKALKAEWKAAHPTAKKDSTKTQLARVGKTIYAGLAYINNVSSSPALDPGEKQKIADASALLLSVMQSSGFDVAKHEEKTDAARVKRNEKKLAA